MVNVWIEYKNKKRVPRTGWTAKFQEAAQIAATFAFVAVLWYSRSATSVYWNHFISGFGVKIMHPGHFR